MSAFNLVSVLAVGAGWGAVATGDLGWGWALLLTLAILTIHVLVALLEVDDDLALIEGRD
jgi:hypothetical protein